MSVEQSGAFEHRESKRVAARTWLCTCFGFDLRSLAALRIVASACYLYELLCNFSLLSPFLTDGGLFPRRFLVENEQVWSIYLAFGSLPAIQLLYFTHILCIVCILMGYRTRWASLASFLMVGSLQNRFPFLPGWETEIRCMYLVGVFLPWAQVWSVDARRRHVHPVEHTCVSAATVAWRIQVAVLYVGSGLMKLGPGWADGTAVEVSLASDGYSTQLGQWLLHLGLRHPPSLMLLNYAVPLVEIFVPLFLFCPVAEVQFLAVLVLGVMQFCFGMCLSIGNFSLICCGCLAGFIPGSLWEFLGIQARNVAGLESPRPKGLWRKPIESALMTWLSLSILISAVFNLPDTPKLLTETFREPWVLLGVEQHWSMFVPPPFDGGWHIVKGRTRAGQWVDLMHDRRSIDELEPGRVSKLYSNVRLYLFFSVYLRQAKPEFHYLQLAVAEYYRRHWENAHPVFNDRLLELQILYYKRRYEPGHGFKQAEKVEILKQTFE
jgi:uncharacterized membrane protein YphA (DoxX/SURF4 family)